MLHHGPVIMIVLLVVAKKLELIRQLQASFDFLNGFSHCLLDNRWLNGNQITFLPATVFNSLTSLTQL